MADNVNLNPTPDEQARYVQEGSDRCVFENCLSHGLEYEQINCGESGVTQEVHCPACGGNWEDLYTVTAVERVVPVTST